MIPCLSQVCSLETPFARDLEDYAAAACRGVEVWLGKLETYLERASLDDARRLLEEQGLSAPVASYQGGLFTPDAAARATAEEHFARRLAMCRALGVATLVVAADFHAPLRPADLEAATERLRRAGDQAAARGVRLAVEFQARSTFCNNLQTAAAWIEMVAHPHVGLCLDAFHFHVGPSKLEDLAAVTAENLFHVQLCDLAGLLREFAADAERILPGDGDLPLPAIVGHLRAIDYRSAVSVEVLNPLLWRVPARQMAEIAMTALRTTLGQSAMA